MIVAPNVAPRTSIYRKIKISFLMRLGTVYAFPRDIDAA